MSKHCSRVVLPEAELASGQWKLTTPKLARGESFHKSCYEYAQLPGDEACQVIKKGLSGFTKCREDIDEL
jgi:hypothetical protein